MEDDRQATNVIMNVECTTRKMHLPKPRPVISQPVGRKAERCTMHDFDAIYAEYHPKILRYLQRLCGEEDSVDLAQTVFLNVSRSLDSFRGESTLTLTTWIYRIATNAARDHTASSAIRQKEWEEPFADDSLPEEVSEKAFPPADREYIRREMSTCIREVIEGLPAGYRSVLILSEFDDLSNSEIGDILDISIDSVKIRLHRARKALREALKCECHFYRDERNELMCDRRE